MQSRHCFIDGDTCLFKHVYHNKGEIGDKKAPSGPKVNEACLCRLTNLGTVEEFFICLVLTRVALTCFILAVSAR